MFANHIKKTITELKKYQNIKWVKLNNEKDWKNNKEKKKILNIFISKKDENEKAREKSLFFIFIGVVKFKIKSK